MEVDEILPNEISDEIPIDFEPQNDVDVVAEQFKCHNCDKLYTKYDLEVHFADCQKINVCEFCDIKFKDRPTLMNHVKREHEFKKHQLGSSGTTSL